MKKLSYIEDFVQWKEGFHFFHPITVRFSETDMFGHLNNTVPFIYFEQARIEFFKHLGFFQEWTKRNSEAIPVVANLQCDYLKQVYFDQEINIFVKVQDIGNSSVDLHYLAEANGEPVFVGRGTLVQMSTTTGKGVPWTPLMKEQMASISGLQLIPN